MKPDRSVLPLIFGTSHEIPARDVQIGDEIAIRNSCGGLESWACVVGTLKYKIIQTKVCMYDVCRDDELVEVRAK